jgi:hypothetical protein
MVEIRSYASKFRPQVAEKLAEKNRFIVYAAAIPALMIEFFDDHYHIYGPTSMTVEKLIDNAVLGVEAISRYSERLPPDFLRGTKPSNISLTWATINGDISTVPGPRIEPLANVGSAALEFFLFGITDARSAVPADAAYFSISVFEPGLVLWADVYGTTNPRSGVALGFPLFSRTMLPVIKSLTTVPWREEEDGVQVADFVNKMWHTRYV